MQYAFFCVRLTCTNFSSKYFFSWIYCTNSSFTHLTADSGSLSGCTDWKTDRACHASMSSWDWTHQRPHSWQNIRVFISWTSRVRRSSRMSRFGMGFGKDPPKDIQGTRPAVRINSARNQEILNKWFQSADKPRPEWIETLHSKSNPTKPQETGEWKLVWHPRSRMGSPTVGSSSHKHIYWILFHAFLCWLAWAYYLASSSSKVCVCMCVCVCVCEYACVRARVRVCIYAYIYIYIYIYI